MNAWNNLVGYKVGNGVLTPYWQGDIFGNDVGSHKWYAI
jgi:hypothetical protein